MKTNQRKTIVILAQVAFDEFKKGLETNNRNLAAITYGQLIAYRTVADLSGCRKTYNKIYEIVNDAKDLKEEFNKGGN